MKRFNTIVTLLRLNEQGLCYANVEVRKLLYFVTRILKFVHRYAQKHLTNANTTCCPAARRDQKNFACCARGRSIDLIFYHKSDD